MARESVPRHLKNTSAHAVAPARYQARRAALGLPSKEYLLEQIDGSIADGCGGTLLAVVELKDFDRLYSFDPEAAQHARAAFALKLRQVLGQAYPMAHVDGGSFGIWFAGIEVDAAKHCLNTAGYALRAEIETPSSRLLPDLSFKLGVYPDNGRESESLLLKVLLNGRMGALTESDSEQLAVRQKHRYSLEQGLRRAVERQELALQFQPIVDLTQGKIVSAEALIRWNHTELGEVSPAIFVPLLEDMELIGEIGMWSLNAACGALRTWHELGHRHLTVAVNLSPKQLRDPNLVLAVERTLRRQGIPAEALTLELTETAAIQDTEATAALFHRLKELSVKLSIDDFGAGYSSLSCLMKLPFDKLKIDREFVTNVHRDRKRLAICQSLVALANGLELDLVAEGAERLEEVETLQGIGCPMVQGFYFSRPVSSDEFSALAARDFWRSATAGYRGLAQGRG